MLSRQSFKMRRYHEFIRWIVNRPFLRRSPIIIETENAKGCVIFYSRNQIEEADTRKERPLMPFYIVLMHLVDYLCRISSCGESQQNS